MGARSLGVEAWTYPRLARPVMVRVMVRVRVRVMVRVRVRVRVWDLVRVGEVSNQIEIETPDRGFCCLRRWVGAE